jgi:hypothetical protein
MFFMTKAALKHLKRGAAIVNTTSVTAYRCSRHLIDYASTKGAIVSFTVSRKWFAFPAVISAFLLQQALQGWCPPMPVLRRLGYRTRTEIDHERFPLKALRGDIEDLADPRTCGEPWRRRPRATGNRAMIDALQADLLKTNGRYATILLYGSAKAPGGPPGLQNQCTGDELVGGFDSHALPPYLIIPIAYHPITH